NMTSDHDTKVSETTCTLDRLHYLPTEETHHERNKCQQSRLPPSKLRNPPKTCTDRRRGKHTTDEALPSFIGRHRWRYRMFAQSFAPYILEHIGKLDNYH